jgi:hypothetical protein
MSNKVKVGLILTVLLALLSWIYDPLPSLHLPEKPVMQARTQATGEEKRENKRIAREYSKALGYTPREVSCLITLWTRESRFDHLADNKRSSAYGIAQLLRERSSRPELQVLHGLRYLDHRYRGSACRALAHHAKGWY